MTRYQGIVLLLMALSVLAVVGEYRTQQRRKGVKSRQDWEDERALRGVPRRA